VVQFFHNIETESAIWYSCGHWKMDVANLNAFLKCAPKECRYVIERIDVPKHEYFFKDIKRIYDVMETLSNIRRVQKV
jgi:hypothetical protein